MSADVTVILNVNLPGNSPGEILACLSSTYSKFVEILDPSFSIPTNAGFKGVDVKRFKKEYTKNWRLKSDAHISIEEDDHSPYQLIGPYGFTASYFNDTIVIEHATRWLAFTGDLDTRRRFVGIAKLVGEVVCSTKAFFLPDSEYEISCCLDLMLKEYTFQDIFRCVEGKCIPLDAVDFVPNSHTLQLFIAKH